MRRTRSVLGTRTGIRSCAALCVLLLVACDLLTGIVVVGPAPPASAAGAVMANPADFDCTLPPLPHGVAHSSRRTTTLSGPAVSALEGGAARHGLSLDGGALVVTPPRGGPRPVLSERQALCAAMQSTADLSGVAAQGVAAGYGIVGVARRFFPAVTGFPSPGQRAATYPSVASFHDRLAWLVVVHVNPVALSCPAERAPEHLVAPSNGDGYKVFMIDALTGTDALVYTEGGTSGCTRAVRVPPTVGVAEESVSVPWTLVSRDPDGYSGTIAATVLPCDQVPGTVLVDRSAPDVGVRVTRPYGPPCGSPENVPIALHAAVVTADLPPDIGHDPVGLTNMESFPPPGPITPAAVPTTSTTTPALVPVSAASNGQTLELVVGQVVTVQPLPGSEGFSLTNPAVSSDPAVLGPLTAGSQPLVAELRAWRTGTAEIEVPQSACVHPGSDQVPCAGPFVVHVVVH